MSKLFTTVVSLGLILAGGSSFAHDGDVHSATNLTAGELALHRTEKLVLLNKIAPAFQSEFKGVEVINLPGAGAGQPTFKVVVSQEVDAGAAANKVEITEDDIGKALGNTTVSGTSASTPTIWSAKDPLTLSELAVHHVEHLSETDQKVAQFIASFTALRISQVSDSGKQIAQVEIAALGISQKLILSLNLDGSLISAEIK